MDAAKLTVLAHSTKTVDGTTIGFLHGYLGDRRWSAATPDIDYHRMAVFALETGDGSFEIDPDAYPVGTGTWPHEWPNHEGLDLRLLPNPRGFDNLDLVTP